MTSVLAENVSAFFNTTEEVDHVIHELVATGVPRDLIDVVVSPAANREHYGGRARRYGARAAKYAGAGALFGLLFGALISVEIILVFPGVDPPARELSVAQLLGPNVTTIVGAALGALIGAFRRLPARGPYERAMQRDELLVVVRSQRPSRVRALVDTLEAAGGRDAIAQREPGSRRRHL